MHEARNKKTKLNILLDTYGDLKMLLGPQLNQLASILQNANSAQVNYSKSTALRVDFQTNRGYVPSYLTAMTMIATCGTVKKSYFEVAPPVTLSKLPKTKRINERWSTTSHYMAILSTSSILRNWREEERRR